MTLNTCNGRKAVTQQHKNCSVSPLLCHNVLLIEKKSPASCRHDWEVTPHTSDQKYGQFGADLQLLSFNRTMTTVSLSCVSLSHLKHRSVGNEGCRSASFVLFCFWGRKSFQQRFLAPEVHRAGTTHIYDDNKKVCVNKGGEGRRLTKVQMMLDRWPSAIHRDT